MGRMTIKQLADVLGVSKTAIRKYLTAEFRENHVETTENQVITISETGCKLIAETMGKTANLSQNSANSFAETAKTAENPEQNNQSQPLEALILMLQKELEEKNAQLAAKDRQIEQLTSALDHTTSSLQAAQVLHAGTMQQHQLEAPGAKKPWYHIFKKSKE